MIVLLEDDPQIRSIFVRVVARFDLGVSMVTAEDSAGFRGALHQLSSGRAPVVMVWMDRNHIGNPGEEDLAFVCAVPRDAAPGGIQLRSAVRLFASGDPEVDAAMIRALGAHCSSKPMSMDAILHPLRAGTVALARAVRADLQAEPNADYIRGEVCMGLREVVQDSLRDIEEVAERAQAAIARWLSPRGPAQTHSGA
ncbi:MAG: hypothetical protein KC933_00925 [Myxococcales bacterium]|nr:hypothetical protein [Myxococcales bacterium]MCB9648573.1 hypothetical protein [Deltaproteobacteria bacterium]